MARRGCMDQEAPTGDAEASPARQQRNTVGDLTSTLGFGNTDTSLPPLPAAPDTAPAACPNARDPISLLAAAPRLTIPTNQQMPSQESGSPRRRS